jgi:hypothetical protein
MRPKKKVKSIYQGIRKDTAPPTKRFKDKKKVQKSDIVGRKKKHKGED